MKKYRVAVLANLKKNAPHWEGMLSDQWDDLDSESTVQALVAAIRSEGHESEFLEGDATLLDTIRVYKPDICFNICESHFGDAREAQVPALLEMLRIPYTGSKVSTLALALDKPMTKRVLMWHELPTPDFQTFERVDEPLFPELKFPLFVKPSREGTGMGVSAQSMVKDEKELREQLKFIIGKYNQPALVEEFVEGREITIGMIGNLKRPAGRRIPYDLSKKSMLEGLKFFPPLEVDLNPYLETDLVYSNRLKVEIPEKLNYLCPAPLSPEVIDELNWLAGSVFRVTGSVDVARVDIRLDKNNHDKPYILEINPLPGLSPKISDIVIEAEAAGVGHTELVLTILHNALKRYNML
jgi:D-alanine-D-alanine ligase